MDSNIVVLEDYLSNRFTTLKDIVWSFKNCSKYGSKYLVNSEIKCINFDKLTEWISKPNPKPKSADSICFNNSTLFFIEFKSGDQTTHKEKISKLINGVSGKINESDSTITSLYTAAFGNDVRIEQKFYLVVDSEMMGIDPFVTTLATLSLRDNPVMNENESKLFNTILPNLKSNVDNPSHYSDVDIWYSELFDTYLKRYNITDFKI